MSAPEDFTPSQKVPSPQTALRRSARHIRDWVALTALPYWADRAQRRGGDWVEHLTLKGEPDLKAERRWRINARQAVAYAQADLAGWFKGEDIARRSFDAYWSQGWTGTHLVHRILPDGTVSDGRPDLYDHAFGLLACARMFKLTGETQFRDKAGAITRYVHLLAHPCGGWGEGEVVPHPRRQNPHMHLLEASLALFDATKDAADLHIAHQVMALFENHFLQGDVIGEFFTDNWQPHAERGDVVEPGHAAEWIWLLGQYDQATGADHSAHMQALYDRVFKQRLVRLFDEERRDGTIIRQTTRLWVQTEAIKAHLAMAEQGMSGAVDMAAASIDALFGTFLLPDGGWVDQMNVCDGPVAKTMPVSTLYHIVGMAVEANRVAVVTDI